MQSSELEDRAHAYGSDQLSLAAELGGILLDADIKHVNRISGGGNNGMFRIISSKGEHALKLYRRDPNDPRDRLGAEEAAITFMRKHGIEQVPKLIAQDAREQCAVFDWIDGQAITSPTMVDIDTAWQFAARLHELINESDAEKIALASDACLSFQDIASQAEQRMERFLAHDGLSESCRGFLEKEFRPALTEIVEHERAFIESTGLDFTSVLERDEQTLSPSDFGFHNAIRTPTGDIVFLDFEYFGWDDPAKLICDFVLHPGMRLSDELRDRFVTQADSIYSGNERLMERMHHALPLYALRWCMIVLNVFLRNDAEIELADAGQNSAAVVKRQRLARARDLLSQAITIDRMI